MHSFHPARPLAILLAILLALPAGSRATDLPTHTRLSNGDVRKVVGSIDEKHAWIEGRGVIGWLAEYKHHGLRIDPSGAIVQHGGDRSHVPVLGQLCLKRGDFSVPGNGFLCSFPSDARITVLERVQDDKDKKAGRTWLRVRVESDRIALPVKMIKMSAVDAAKTDPPPPAETVPDNHPARHDLLDGSSERARLVLRETIPDERALDDAALALLLAIDRLGTDDPAKIAAALAEEEKLAAESGDGDALRVADVVVPDVPATPGARIDLTIVVTNDAPEGNPARFDLVLSDQHGDGTPLHRVRGLSIAPGETKRVPVPIPAPRDFHLAGWAHLEPARFRGGEYPSLPFKIKVIWDGATMTDAEILADLTSLIPDKRFEIFEEHRAAWITRYRESPGDCRGAIAREALAYVRELERAETEAWWNDPEQVARRAADDAADAESAKLREFLALEAYARRQAPLQGIDLPGLLEDMVYVDEQARVHGDLGAARARLDAEIRRRNDATVRGETAVARWLLGTPETSPMHRRTEATLAGTTALLGAANPGGATVDAAGRKILDELMGDYKNLMAAHRTAGTRPEIFAKDLDAVRTKVELLKRQVPLAAPGRGREMMSRVVAAAEGDLAKLADVQKKGMEFGRRADALLAKKRGYEVIGKSVSNLCDAWSLYDGHERMNARIAAGEDATAALSQESLKLGVKKVMTNNPVVGAADAIMSGVGHLAYAARRKKYDAEGFDPRQYNASTLADIGVDGSVAHLADMSSILGKRSVGSAGIDDEERARLKKRMDALEAEIAATTDPAVRERLLTARRYARERLEGR